MNLVIRKILSSQLYFVPTGGRDSSAVHQREGHLERSPREAEGHDRVVQGPLRRVRRQEEGHQGGEGQEDPGAH